MVLIYQRSVVKKGFKDLPNQVLHAGDGTGKFFGGAM